MGGHITAHYGTSPDYRPLADSYIRQDDAVRTDKYVIFNNNFSVTGQSSGSRIKVRNYRRSESDRAVVPNCYVRGMYFIDVNKLADPDIASDHNSAPPLQPRSEGLSSWSYKGYPTSEPSEQNWQNQRLCHLDFDIRNTRDRTCLLHSTHRSAARFRSTFSWVTAAAENSGMFDFFDTTYCSQLR